MRTIQLTGSASILLLGVAILCTACPPIENVLQYVWVADRNNNRVLLMDFSLPLLPSNPQYPCPVPPGDDYTCENFGEPEGIAVGVVGQRSAGVTGQNNDANTCPNQDCVLSTNPGQYTLAAPTGLALAPNGTLWVADTANTRVLGYAPQVIPTSGFVNPPASYLIGQSTFSAAPTQCPQTGPGLTNSTLCVPQALALDSFGNLWVADSGACRVLRFPAASLVQYPASGAYAPPQADVVIGEPDFATACQWLTNGIASNLLESPGQIAFQGNNVWVADSGSGRVLEFPNPGASGNQQGESPAIVVYGTPGATGIPSAPPSMIPGIPNGVAFDGLGNMWVSSFTFVNYAEGITAGQVTELLPGSSGFYNPSVGASLGTAPVDGIPSPYTLASPTFVTFAGSDLWVSDTAENRVLEFQAADAVAGGCGASCTRNIDCPQLTPYCDTSTDMCETAANSGPFCSGDPATFVIGETNAYTACESQPYCTVCRCGQAACAPQPPTCDETGYSANGGTGPADLSLPFQVVPFTVGP
jgi:hypothetical protein